MIELINDNDKKEILETLSKDIYQNPYLYIDTITFGFMNDNIQTWKVIEDGIVAIIYKYYNSLQLFAIKSLSDDICKEIASFIVAGNFEMTTGHADVILSLKKYLSEYTSSVGYIMSFDSVVETIDKNNIKVASYDELEQSAALVCADSNIGGHYTIPQLTKQFSERMLNSGCINVVCKDEDKVVCHAATYADMKEFAIIGGIITNPKYRGRGLARITTTYLVSLLQSKNKTPLIYCYEPYLFEWYKNIGFSIKSKCGKLERNR